MATRKRQSTLCIPADSGCGNKRPEPPTKKAVNNRKVYRTLDEQGAVVSLSEQQRFVNYLNQSIRHRELVPHRLSKDRLKDDDIMRLIQVARDAGVFDEAIWRSFLAAHFGRPSANPEIEDQLESAALLLCGFGSEPRWTWNKVSAHQKKLRNWLYDHAVALDSLSFGNHRKYESHKPDLLWEVIGSFIDLANEYGGPMALVTVDANADDPFHVLYRRIRPLYRFGRTGRFDFLVTLLDLGLISAEPKSPYLRGATGPLVGAKKLWGELAVGKLDELAAQLAVRLGVSPIVMEDALCNWQK